MKNESVTNWFQIAASVGVLFGLVLVWYELDQSKNLARSSLINQSYSDGLADIRALWGENPMAILKKSCFDEPLTAEEHMITNMYFASQYMSAERWITLNAVSDFGVPWQVPARGGIENILWSKSGREYFQLVRNSWHPEMVLLAEEILKTPQSCKETIEGLVGNNADLEGSYRGGTLETE